MDNSTDTNEINHFTPHPPLPLKGGGLACLPVGRGGGDVILFNAFVLVDLSRSQISSSIIDRLVP